tara:strand:+ start:2269 stop:2808 length:540 start_codon:yes stop_codon:yes gene_type:complete
MKKLLLIFLSFLGCSKIDENGFKSFKIKKDCHRSGYRYKSDKRNYIEFDVIFDESAIYTTKSPLNQADVNKLYGVSDCGKNHMKYSIRFGWRYYNDSLQILWFKHEAGEFTFDVIKKIKINRTYTLSLHITENEYILCVDNVCTITNRTCPKTYRRYYLYPYFGGDETAPHDIVIKIKD